IIITRIPIKFIIKGLTPIWFLIIFTFLLHLFLTKEGSVAFEILSYKFYWGGIKMGLVISLRFCLLVLMNSLLTLTTTPIEITDATARLLGPLNMMMCPVCDLSFMMSISLRFIPTHTQ